MINLLVALCPVLALLVALLAMDSFRMVRPSSVAMAIAYGVAAAALSLWWNEYLLNVLHVAPAVVTRYVAPPIEEAVKALLVVGIVAAGRVAFPVDAAIYGFAVGTGFALVENLTYLQAMPNAGLALWVVRGLGTAVLQGALTAMFAMAFRTLIERRSGSLPLAILVPWTAVAALHSLFNHRLLPPLAQTLLILMAMPLGMLWVYARSERATREWIGAGLDLDLELLALVNSEAFLLTRFTQHLQPLRQRFPPTTLANMYCLLRVELELSIQAKAMLLAREAAVDVPVDDDLDEALAEWRFLRQAIGREGLMALEPLQVTGRRDRWHRHILQQRLAPTSRRSPRRSCRRDS